MSKIKSLIILFIAVFGAYMIYHHFENKRQEEVVIDKFSSEYNLVDEDNVFLYSTIDEVISVLESGTGFVFLCTPESTWCNYYAKYLNEELKANNVDHVYYYNIRNDRALNTMKYQKILSLLDQFIYKDDTSNGKIYMPDLTVVKNGEIVAHNNDTSLIASDQKGEDYWTEAKQNEFKKTIQEYVLLINE